MITITANLAHIQGNDILTLIVNGHALNREDCSRVTGMLDIFTQMTYNERKGYVKKSGYTEVLLDISDDTKKDTVLLGLKAFKDLEKHYPNTITFIFTED